MGGIRIVKSFCGCFDLKAACVALAGFRLGLSVFGVIVIIAIFFGEIEKSLIKPESDKEALGILTVLMFIGLIIVFLITLINIIFSYWFIRGVISVRHDQIQYKTQSRKLFFPL